MKALIVHIAVIAALVLCSAGISHAQNEEYTAYAIPLSGITIDGRLDDWPEDMIRYPILNHGQAYGPTDIDNADLTSSADLTPYFMVGYNPEKNIIYLAVRVRDDILSVANIDHRSTDACEIYIDGTNTNKRIDMNSISDVNSLAAMQYVMWPPGGIYRGKFIDNPGMYRGNIKPTKTVGLFSRNGDLSVYEWAIEAFDHYPDKPTNLTFGKTIGFDVVIVDKDENIDNPAWVCWGQFAIGKFIKADTLGDLLLLKDKSELGSITGKVTHHFNGYPWEGLLIKVEDIKGVIHGAATTDTDGHYHIWCLPRSYNLSLAVDNITDPIKVDIKAGKRIQNINFSPNLGSISGKVIFIGNGTYRAGISINVEEVEGKYFYVTTTDTDGSYCHWVKPGNYIVSTSNARSVDSKRIKIRAGEEIMDINFKLTEVDWDDLLQNERIFYLTEAIKLDNSLVHNILPRSLYEYNIDPRKAVHSLLDLLKEDSPNIRELTIDVLAKNTHYMDNYLPIFIESVFNLLYDDDPDVRISAVSALVALGDQANNAVPVLIELLNDKDRNVRCSAVTALGKIGKDTKNVIPLLIKMLENEEANVKIAVISALGDFGHESSDAIQILLKMAKQEHQIIRESAIKSLGKICYDDKEVISFLIGLLDSNITVIQMAAINALKEIGSNAIIALPNLISLVTFKAEGTYYEEKVDKQRLEAADVIVTISQSLLNNLNVLRESDINETIQYLEIIKLIFESDKSLAGTNNERLIAVNGAINGLKAKYSSHQYIRLIEWVVAHQLHKKPWVLIIVLYVLVSIMSLTAWFILLWKRPLWLFILNEKLRFPDVRFEWFGDKPIGIRHFFLLNFFNYHSRVLNAWVWKYLDRARHQFNRLQTVKERAEHIPLPVKFDDRIIEQPQASDFREVFVNQRTCMLIWGEGGSGKTSLACRLAKWGMGEDLDQPLSGFPMLPVIIEHDIHETPGEEHPLVEAIDRQIEIMTGVDDIDLELLYRLLKSGRILVIVDRFSEMDAETRKIFQPGHNPKLKINSMIVTSRLDEPLQGAMMSNVQPLRIDRDHLLPFMVAYLHQEIFEDSEYFEACMRMSKMAGIRGITALLAKLYAEQMIGTREGDITIEDLPDNILDLMLSYLNWINRNRTEKDPDDRTIHRISKAIARAALEHDFRPADASLHAIQTALADESDLDWKLTYMSEKLGVIRFVGASKNRLRITLDPLAEYLAGLRFIELYGSDEEQWRKFLDEMQKKHGVDGTVEGFLLAVIDCCLAEGREYGVPGFVETELARSVDIELKVQ